jgi:hypothetical protein
MAESIERKSDHLGRMEERYIVHIDRQGRPGPIHKEHSKVIIIEKGDTAIWEGTAPNDPDLHYFYSYPGTPEGGDVRIKVFRYDNDSIDSLIIVRPENGMSWEEMENFNWNEAEMEDLMRDQQKAMIELQLSEEALQDQMKDIQMDIEMDIPEDEFRHQEFYFNEPVYTPMHPGFEIVPEPPVRQSEKIIRQELRDDGLTTRGKKYVVEIDGKSMFINGEKQPKEIYKKYRKLVEGTEQLSFEGDDTFKMIF